MVKIRQRTEQRRFDPYKNFKFRVMWQGRYVAGFSEASGLRGRSRSRKLPGLNKHPGITLKRGVTHDKEFAQWANTVAKASAGVPNDIVLEVCNEAGQVVRAYKIYRCWISEFRGLPDLDANANAVTIEHMKLENEGWER